MPTLHVLLVSGSFAELWPRLAEGAGLSCAASAEPPAGARASDSVMIVAAGGAEDELDAAVRRVATSGMEVIAVGALPDHRVAASAVRAGAADYFALPDDIELLRAWVGERASRLRAGADRHAFTAREGEKYRFEGILGSSRALVAALDRASRVIPHGSVTVLIQGETGTGKELLARAIHYNGPRRTAPFVDVNCAAIPETLLESELFGHEKGAFTDATSTKPGLFEVASGGTLFLDEIGHLPLTLQGKLLRALEERAVRRVGGTRTIQVDVRIMAASHVDLRSAVARGEFREDLFFRLNVIPLELPPLRARREDVVPLARHFLERFAEQYGLAPPTLSAGATRALTMREWPGNVRELRNAVERALLLSSGGELGADDFAAEVATSSRAGDGLPFPATLREITTAAARATVELCDGNKSEAARRLGISRTRLQRLLDARDDTSDDEDTDE
jgi:DNA-binding NtrC family response regulator